MSAINYDQVRGLLLEAGLVLEGELQTDTPKIVRVPVTDQPRGKRPGYYRLWESRLADGSTVILGVYGLFLGAEKLAYKIPFPSGATKKMDPGALAAARARQALDAKREEADRKHRAARAADKAAAWWGQCQEGGTSPYLERKGLAPGRLYGARISPQSGNLVIPLLNGKGAVQGLQVIYHDPAIKRKKGRDKDYAPPGLVKAGHWMQIGSPHAGGVLILCEGFATGASLHEATALPVVVAFDAGNLAPVAKALASRYRGANVLICADDDYLTVPNTGHVKAQEAALVLGDQARVLLPNFAEPTPGAAPIVRSDDKSRKGPTDFNDLHVHPQGGLHVVRAQIDLALAAANWGALAATARGALGPGAGATHPPTGSGGGTGGAARPEAVSCLGLDQLAERFVHIDDATGDFAFDNWTNAVVRKSKIIAMLPARVRWDDVKDHPRWRTRAVYIDQIGFDPGGEDPNIICNRWGGWPTTPKAGSCDFLLTTLRYLTEQEPREVYEWILKWLAYPIQHPGAKMHTALVFHGHQGTGKSRFFESYAKIYGEYAQVLNQGALEDKFNSDWAERKLFVVCDEVAARSELYMLKNQLKGLITGEWIRVNPKNVAAHREKNHMNLVFLSNEVQPAVLENDDRRHMVIWTPPKLAESWYQDLSAEIANGGIEALHHYLLHLDLGDFKPWSLPPPTAAKADLININRESADRFIEEWEDGLIDGLPLCPAASSDVYAAYAAWCRREGVKYPRESNQFAGFLLKQDGWTRGIHDRYDSTHYVGPAKRQRFFIPGPELMERAAARDPAADYRQKSGQTKTQWLTDCYFAFHNAAKGGYPSDD